MRLLLSLREETLGTPLRKRRHAAHLNRHKPLHQQFKRPHDTRDKLGDTLCQRPPKAIVGGGARRLQNRKPPPFLHTLACFLSRPRRLHPPPASGAPPSRPGQATRQRRRANKPGADAPSIRRHPIPRPSRLPPSPRGGCATRQPPALHPPASRGKGRCLSCTARAPGGKEAAPAQPRAGLGGGARRPQNPKAPLPPALACFSSRPKRLHPQPASGAPPSRSGQATRQRRKASEPGAGEG